jgi:hypothetical protein
MRVLLPCLATVLLVCLVAAAALFPRATLELNLGSTAASSDAPPVAKPAKTLHPKSKAASWAMVRTEFAPPPAPATSYEPLANARVGIAYADLIERCGPPSMEITGEDGLRKLTYGSTRVLLREGMVTAIVVPNVRK